MSSFVPRQPVRPSRRSRLRLGVSGDICVCRLVENLALKKIETVPNVPKALLRVKQLAQQTPGSYIAYNPRTGRVVAKFFSHEADFKNSFHILKRYLDGDVTWIESARHLQAAKRRIKQLASRAPGEYIVFCQLTQGIVATSSPPVRLSNPRVSANAKKGHAA